MNLGPIDVVYTWCSHNDRQWMAKRMTYADRYGLDTSGYANNLCRYRDNDELKYSLRSLEAYAPWFNRVHLVIDDDATPPQWMRTDHPRLSVVRHSEIIPAEFLPCFTAMNIEHFLCFIPGLAARFLLANDDTMIGRPVNPEFFYAADGFPYVRITGKPKSRTWHPENMYQEAIKKTIDMVALRRKKNAVALRKLGYRMPHHNIDAYCTEDVRRCRVAYDAEIRASMPTPFHHPDNIQRILYSYEALLDGHAHMRQARRDPFESRSWWRRLIRPSFAETLQLVGADWRKGPRTLTKMKPALFCFNDTQKTREEDVAWLHLLYERMFPAVSSFENARECR